MKKIAILCSLLALSTSVASASFSDVTASNQYAAGINYVKSAGYVDGYPDKSYKPNNQINRAEFTKIIVNIYFGEALAKEGCTKQIFPDVSPTAWYGPFVCEADKYNVVGGYPDGTFKPEGKINFAEAAKIILESSGNGDVRFEQSPTDKWYVPYINALKSKNAMPASIKSPDQQITRGEMAYMIWKFEGLGAMPDELYTSMQDYINIVTSKAGLDYQVSKPTSVTLFKMGDTPADVNSGSPSMYVYIVGNPSGLETMVEFYLNVPSYSAGQQWYGPFKGRILGMMQ